MLMNSLFLEQMKELLGDEYEQYLAVLDQPAGRGIRVNTLKTTADELFELADLTVQKSPFADNGYYVKAESSLGRMNAYKAGLFYVQEPSASSAVTILDPKPGMKVLDLCAAPGSKSTQIAEKLGSDGFLCLNEYMKNRIQPLVENVEQHGISNAMILNNDTADIAKAFPEFFDAVLCDAPCSGEGMFRKEEEAVRQWSPEYVELCAQRQREILDNAEKCLKPGGVLVYSTCTLNRIENEETVLHFLNAHDNMVMEDAGVTFGRKALISDHHIDRAVRIFPMDGGEGHFIAKMRKQGTSRNEKIRTLPQSRIPSEADAFFREMLSTQYPYHYVFRDRVYGGSAPFFEAKGCRLIRNQVYLGEIIKKRFEPSHQFFMSSYSSFRRTVQLSDEEAEKYLHGEQIPHPCAKGWYAVMWHGHALGGAKSDGTYLKNKYPKQLRLR